MKLGGGLLALAVVGSSAAALEWPDFQAEGPGLRPSGNLVGGLGFQVSLQDGPRLLKEPVPYYSIQEGGKQRPRLDFGTVTAGPTGGPVSVLEGDWAHVVLSASPAFKLHVSRLTPALVVESTAPRLTFFGGEKAALPAVFATSQGVLRREQLGDATFDGPDRLWLLVWFGQEGGFQSTRFPFSYDGRGWMPDPASPVDCPLLFLFQKAPAKLEMQSQGLVVDWGEPAGEAIRLALLPLFGESYPPVSETEAWTSSLPEAVIQQCDRWAEHLAEVPMTARETAAYDEKTDTVTLTAKIGFLRIREGGTRFAPLPPMLALAREQGFPLELSGEVVRTSVLTAVGPYAGLEGVEQYTCRVTGLGKYVREVRQVSSEAKEPERLARRLREEVSKVLQAGHLAPWYPAVNVFGAGYRTYLFNPGTLTWSNPGETLFFLGEVLPLLEPDQQAEVIAYLKKERADYPPEQIAVLRADEGARRERWRLEEAEIQDILLEHNELVQRLNFYVTNHLIPEENLYYLAGFERHTDTNEVTAAWPKLREILTPYLSRQDWATLGWYRWPGGNATFNGCGGVVDANHHFAALVGALRLAHRARDAEGEVFLWGQFARAAILRYALGRYAHYLHGSQLLVLPPEPDWMVRFFEGSWMGHLYTYDWTGPGDDVRSVVRLSEFGVQFDDVLTYYSGKGLLPYRGLVPELARFLADYEKPWARAFVDRVAENMPDWYLALCTANLGAEYNYLLPEDSYQCFLARAWILGEPPEKLAGFLDVSWMARGDWYYLHKLAETIKAYRGVTWETLARR